MSSFYGAFMMVLALADGSWALAPETLSSKTSEVSRFGSCFSAHLIEANTCSSAPIMLFLFEDVEVLPESESRSEGSSSCLVMRHGDEVELPVGHHDVHVEGVDRLDFCGLN